MSTNNNILIVEDELIIANGIAEFLAEEEFDVMGIAKSAAEAFAICRKTDTLPAVVLCDINIQGDIKGSELAHKLKEEFDTEIIFLTAYSDSKTLQQAFAADPVMYLVKPYNDAQLLVAVQMAFHKFIKRQTARNYPKLDLTEREKEIARLIAEGLTSKQVARQLFISVETVKTHRRRMLQKNNISNFPHLVYIMNKEAL
jgi:DNA-binding NarL/FixJ family response regulator